MLMHLVAGCVMEGSVVLCQKNILEHSMRFHGDSIKGCLLTLLVSQSYRVMRNQLSNMQLQSSFNCAILPICQKQCKLIVNYNLLFHFPWFICASTFSNFFILVKTDMPLHNCCLTKMECCSCDTWNHIH